MLAGMASLQERNPVGRWAAVVHIRRAKDLADRAFAEPITLDDLARAAACSRWHLVRAFRAAYGETPGDYLGRRRVERAMELLRSTDTSVTAVCHAVGFTSLGTFSRRFKALVGVSPSEYRRLAERARVTGRIPGCFSLMWTRPSDLAIQEKLRAGTPSYGAATPTIEEAGQ
jgi:AraC-like DNA-binding protein